MKRGAKSTRRVFAIAAIATLMTVGCASTRPVAGSWEPTISGERTMPAVAPRDNGAYPETPPPVFSETEPCVSDDGVVYESSDDLEAAADVIVRGEITWIETATDATTPTWLVGLKVLEALGPDAPRSADDIIVRFPRFCGDFPLGDSFQPGFEYLLALSVESDEISTYSMLSFQGVVPILGGMAIPLPGAHVTISQASATALGAPLPVPPAGEEFVPGEVTLGLPPSVTDYGQASLGAAWSPDPGVLWVFAPGLLDCPLAAAAEAVPMVGGPQGDGIRITLREFHAPGGCPDMMQWYTTRVALPAGLDPDAPMTIYFVSADRLWWGAPGTVNIGPPWRQVPGEPGPAAWAPTNPEDF